MMVSDIQSVKAVVGGYLVNGVMLVPSDPGNRDNQVVQDWIAAGNTPDGETLAEAQARRRGDVNALREAKLGGGFYYDTLDATFDADAEGQFNVVSIAAGQAAGKGFPHGASSIPFWDKDNQPHTMNAAQFLNFAAAHRDWTAAIKVAARTHKDAIDALGSVAAVDAYDITAGW